MADNLNDRYNARSDNDTADRVRDVVEALSGKSTTDLEVNADLTMMGAKVIFRNLPTVYHSKLLLF